MFFTLSPRTLAFRLKSSRNCSLSLLMLDRRRKKSSSLHPYYLCHIHCDVLPCALDIWLDPHSLTPLSVHISLQTFSLSPPPPPSLLPFSLPLTPVMAYPVAVPHLSAFAKHRVAFAAVLAELCTAVDAIHRARSTRPAPPRCVFVLDWDDTCCPTSFLESSGVMADLDTCINEFAAEETRLLRVLENRVLSLLKTAVGLGTVLIVTNAGDGWVELSSNRFLPAVKAFLDDNYKSVKVISARARYVDVCREHPLQWKVLTFTEELRSIHEKEPKPMQPMHVVVLGDSIGDQYAAHSAAESLHLLGMPIILKVVKFLERPTIDQLCKELGVLLDHIGAMHAHHDGFDVSMYRESVPVVNNTQQLQQHQAAYSQQQQQHSAAQSKPVADTLATQSLQPSSAISNSSVDTPMNPVSPMTTCPAAV